MKITLTVNVIRLVCTPLEDRAYISKMVLYGDEFDNLIPGYYLVDLQNLLKFGYNTSIAHEHYLMHIKL